MEFAKDAVRKSRGRLYIYIAYWALYLMFFSVQRFYARSFLLTATGLSDAGVQNSFTTSLLTNLAYLPGVILVTHFVTEFVLPRYYFKNRFFHFSIFLALTILAYPLLSYLVRVLIVDVYINHHPESYSFYNYFASVLIFVFGLAPVAWFKIASHLKEDVLYHQKLDNDRLNALLKLKETELKLLRSQLHPHFLFNTLNNLYSLALEKSDKTPDLIIRLGDMLSYIIYDCNSDKVLLVKEIDFLKSYIELQKVRYVSCDIKLAITGDIDNQKIAPMLLHTFIDNSFKHGAARISGDSWITVSIDVYNGYIDLRVENNKPAGRELKKEAGGIGIENAKKRLQLIYRDRYELNIHQSESTYSVFLKLLL
jgi:sensor histidine kinase YesM